MTSILNTIARMGTQTKSTVNADTSAAGRDLSIDEVSFVSGGLLPEGSSDGSHVRKPWGVDPRAI